MDPEVYTPHNLPPWCFGEDWDRVRILKWMNNRNQRKKERREAEARKAEKRESLQKLRLRKANELREYGKGGNINDDL